MDGSEFFRDCVFMIQKGPSFGGSEFWSHPRVGEPTCPLLLTTGCIYVFYIIF